MHVAPWKQRKDPRADKCHVIESAHRSLMACNVSAQDGNYAVKEDAESDYRQKVNQTEGAKLLQIVDHRQGS